MMFTHLHKKKRSVEKLCKVIEFYPCFGESFTIGFLEMPSWLFMELFGRVRVKIRESV